MRTTSVRTFVQFGFLAFMTWAGYQHQLLGGGPSGAPPVDALCPFGALEGIYAFLLSGEWLRRLAPSVLVLMGGTILATLVAGRVFCGWVCPLGTLGEWSARAARALGIRPRELPYGVDRYARFLKYVVLVVILFLTWRTGTLAWRDFDPWVAYMHLPAGLSALEEIPWGYVVLFGAVILASLFVERFWCRYLCPLGAFLAPFQRFALLRVRRESSTCISCGACDRACPVRIEPQKVEAVASCECLSCGRCVDACPVPGTLLFGGGRKRLSALAVGLLGVALYLGAWGTAKLSGTWQTFATAPLAAKNPADAVYGWMTLAQVAETVELPPEKVLEIAGLSADLPRDVAVKKIPGVNDETLREALSTWFAKVPEPIASVAPGAQAPPPDEIRGTMTAAEVAALYTLDPKEIFRKAGWPETASADAPLKDVAKGLGAEVSAVREAVKALLAERTQ